MARIYPEKPIGALPLNILKTFRALKGLPEAYRVWHNLAPWQEKTPDFLVIDPARKALLVKVCNAGAQEAQSRLQMILLGPQQQKVGQPETNLLLGFLETLSERVDGHKSGGVQIARQVHAVVLFPNLTSKQAGQGLAEKIKRLLHWLGKEYLQTEDDRRWKKIFPPDPLDDRTYHRLRELFTPEAIVPNTISVRKPVQRNLEAGLHDFILDYDQEMIFKSDLDLPAEAEGLSRDFQTSLVNGVTGSGKTLILLYRLRLLVQLYPHKKFLALTHNQPLIHDLQSKFFKLHNNLPSNIHWQTFNQFLRRNWPQAEWRNPLSMYKRDQLIRKVWAERFAGSRITWGMLRSEIDWIHCQVKRSRDDYLSAQRRGRGFRLSQAQREEMYDAYQAYCTQLDLKNTTDWGLLPHLFWKMAQEGKTTIPRYDVLLVDETQFFAPIWFEIIRQAVKPNSGHLFMAADPTQGFLNRGVSWKSMGLEVRGHSFALKRSYRTTHEILSMATLFYRQRIPKDDEDDEILSPEFIDMPTGLVPAIIQMCSPQDEIARVSNEAVMFVQQGIPKSQILILHANWQGVEGLIGALKRKLGPNAAADPKKTAPGDYIRVTTLNAGTGLESPFAFLVGLNQLFEEEQSMGISDEERQQLILENTRKIYMAITRAGQRLVVTYAGSMPEDIQRLFTVELEE